MSADRQLVLLYDGVCGFCDRVVQFVLARDTAGAMKFAPLQGDFAKGVLARHPEMRGIDSLILVHGSGIDEVVTAHSVAVSDLLRYLGGGWNVVGNVMRVVPRFLGDAVYAGFARIRYRVFGRLESCPIPTPTQRARFID